MSEAEPIIEQRTPPSVVIKANIAARLNVAFHQNSVPAIAEIELVNDTGDDIQDLAISIFATPSFLQPRSFRFDHIRAGGTQRLNPVPIDFDAKFLLGLTEAVRGEITIVAKVGEAEIATLTTHCQLLSPSEWVGLCTAPELIAAFVRPNDPSVDVVLRNAAEKLRKAGRDPSFGGYQSRKKARAWELTEAMWAALCDERVVYALPAQSFERNGQKVRSPTAVLERKIGTCLDLALLFAACLEQAGLNPLIGLSEGHAFCGVWLTNDEFSLGVIDEAQTLRKRMQLDELILIETTLLTNQPPVRFAAAVDKGRGLVAEDAERRFELLIDVRHARHRQIKPLTLGTKDGSPALAVAATAGIAATLEAPPIFVDEEVVTEAVDETLDRLERWKRKLLDLSLRNKLLNFKSEKNAVTLICPDPGKFQDKLASGDAIKLLPRADVMGGEDPRSADLHFRKAGDDGAEQYAIEAMRRGDVHTNLSPDELESRLTEIFRSARTSLQEGGANSLYVSVGFVSWTPQAKEQTCKAPLLLVPVSLERRTIRSGFRLVRHDDDARINPTLLQMLRQDFKLIIPEFNRDLPADTSGPDVSQIWRIARQHLKDVKGFELTEDVVLSNFSFVKYLMWKDLVDRTEMLKRNPVVKHLIDTPKESYGDPASMPEETRLDEEVDPSALFMPLPADSSQTASVVAAARGKDFVLFGPPGTGKSQTIANMIVQLLADRKTVLFVSQKTTALEVVRKRLNEIGLGSFCIEVHSAKAQKGAVLSQLKSAWETHAETAAAAWDGATADLKVLRDQLNAVVRSLHRRHRNGLTVQKAMGRVIRDREFIPSFVLSFRAPDQHDEADMRRLRETCRNLKTALDAIGDPSQHPLAGIGRSVWSPVWQNNLVAAARKFCGAVNTLATSAGETTAIFGAPGSGDPHWIYRLLTFGAQAFKPEALSAIVLLTAEGARARETFRVWKAARTRCLEDTTRLVGAYRQGVFDLDLAALLDEWRQASSAMILVRSSRKKRVWEALAAFTDAPMPDDVGAELARLIDIKALRNEAGRYDAILAQLGPIWRGLATDVDQVEALFAWADATRAAADRMERPERPAAFWIEALSNLIVGRSNELSMTGAVRAIVIRLLEGWRNFDAARTDLARIAETADEWLALPLDDDWIIASAVAAQRWTQAANQTQRWCKYREICDTANALGLSPLVAALESGAIARNQIFEAFELGYARWWAVHVVDGEAALRGFVADYHDDAISRFAEMDAEVAKLARRVVLARISGNLPPRTAFGRDPEFGTLAREIEKKSRHLPLRQLFGHMPSALTKLAPCMMMSPLSIAQYLPADCRPFDVVIFDEASQIPVWDAIGAIARGQQVIVVGDPKQLPPTAFFDRSDDGHDDASELEDLESILDECLAANIPHKRLAWHYRSRHESLIAFSNERYYEGRLVTFPSSVTEDRAVRYVHVPGGIYERGSGRVNREEARKVVQNAIQRLTNPAFARGCQSIGIVTFNTEQQRLIENLLDQERRVRPELEKFFGATWHEPVFVKNLESVQGDERDVILFSVAYGADASGRVSQNFGPLNKDGGTRRLNVAITRARSELVVFSTLKPDQIDLSRTKSTGVRDFKHFLEYAERGPRALAQVAAPLDRDTESPFEDAVRKALEERGWIVHPQVGVAGFRVDFGVVHPEAPGRYIAGVECDGATYHRSATARDRDLLRERVLRNLGWRIHRVWSTDWWVHADRATARLDALLRLDLEEERRPAAQTGEANVEQIELPTEAVETGKVNSNDSGPAGKPGDTEVGSRIEPEPIRRYAKRTEVEVTVEETTISDMAVVQPYEVANVETAGLKPDREAFYEMAYRPTLRRMVAYVISTEGPVFEDLLVQRIARAHGFGRAAGKIREIILDVVERRFPRSTEGDRKIFWPEGVDKSEFPSFRSGSLENRDHVDIPLVELASLARRFLNEGAEPEEAAVLIGRQLNLGRLRESARGRFEEAARLAWRHTSSNGPR
jgi:very-short-patch-repair endonuclease